MTAVEVAHWIVVVLGLPLIMVISVAASRALSGRLDTMSRRVELQSERADLASKRLDRLEEMRGISSDLFRAHVEAYNRHCEEQRLGR